jgi:hypothetical protein
VLTQRSLRAEAAFLLGVEAALAHQSGNTVFAAALALRSQCGANSWAAIGLTALLEDGFDHFDKLLVLLVPWTLALMPMSVEAAF